MSAPASPDSLYSVVSFTPAGSKGTIGIAVIQVNGCALQTTVDVPFGTAQGSAAWSAIIDPIVASIIANMDPNSPTYDSSLLAD